MLIIPITSNLLDDKMRSVVVERMIRMKIMIKIMILMILMLMKMIAIRIS